MGLAQIVLVLDTCIPYKSKLSGNLVLGQHPSTLIMSIAEALSKGVGCPRSTKGLCNAHNKSDLTSTSPRVAV